MNKIISFSVWGKNPKYAEAAYENLVLAPKYYPGWTCRFYMDETVPQNIVERMEQEGAETVIMDKSDGCYGLFWRFEPLKDDSIERFIVRDADSRLNPREADAVREWEESGKEFHIMRDNPMHNAPICGGMWGATSKFIDKIKFQYDDMLNEYLESLTFQDVYKPRGKYFNTDQPFLWKYIWPRVINTHIAHIADLKELRLTGNEKLFKVRNPDKTFVGQPIEWKKEL
jgi:hypothetical protein